VANLTAIFEHYC